jgi:hypothetical protein
MGVTPPESELAMGRLSFRPGKQHTIPHHSFLEANEPLAYTFSSSHGRLLEK